MSERERDNSAARATLQCGRVGQGDGTDQDGGEFGSGDTRNGGKRRKAAPLTAERLRSAALWYVERYAASQATVRRFLDRKIRRAAMAGDPRADEARSWIDPILVDFVRAGLIDDGRIAEALAQSRLEKGESRRMILTRLAKKGIDGDLAQQALEKAIDERAEVAPDFAAASRYAARKRLGPYRVPEDRARFRQRDLRALARQGYGAEIAYRLIDSTDRESAEDD